jgi:serine phosphatase RsbU (regulator of sigma subunit)
LTADWPVHVSGVLLAILIFQGLRRRSARDRMIAAAFLFYWFVRLTLTGLFQHLTGLKAYASVGGWHWQYTVSTLTLLGIVTLTILARDLIRDRSEKQRMAAELEAGRAIQQVLIPEEIPTIPGFNIQSVYKPFGEVGGDFFQVLLVKSDNGASGVLAIIGDVSGKGMPAAMTVSLLVGTVRTLAHYTQSPGEILAAMNQRMLARSHGGFTTCLVLRADPGGTFTIANAGHIAPYLGGKELPLENGLPLGLAAETAYAESTFQLAQGRQITLVTDGVVEARDKTGALYGFERTAAISSETAEGIARAAQRFGQDDDITVLTLARTA